MTDIELVKGVTLHLIKEKKFKTIQIMLRFRTPLSADNIAKRVLISNLWETTNQLYPTSRAFTRRLSEMYGSSFNTGVAKKGQQHLLSINMSLVNPKFLDFDTLTAGIDFLHAAIFAPDMSGKAFNPDVFAREQTNLIHYLESMNEDRGYAASLALAKLFFRENAQALPSVSTVELLKAETAQSVFDYYQQMLAQDLIDIYVLGDVAEQDVAALFAKFKFSPRSQDTPVLYQQPTREFVELTEHKEIAQSILQLAYHLPVAYGDRDYLALQVMNGLLGGFAHSKLFTNVREKASLAYSASSTFDSFTGFLKIVIGIDASDYQQALDLTLAQVCAMQNGDFSQDELEQTKTMLRNTYYMGLDSSSNLIELEFVKNLLPERNLDAAAFLSNLTEVTKDDVVRVARSLTYQAKYFMEGADHAAQNL